MTTTFQAPTEAARRTGDVPRTDLPVPPTPEAPPGDFPLPPEDDLSGADERRLRQSAALHLAESLDSAETLLERVTIYRSASRRQLNVAAGLWPELMPILNGELEWIALTLV